MLQVLPEAGQDSGGFQSWEQADPAGFAASRPRFARAPLCLSPAFSWTSQAGNALRQSRWNGDQYWNRWGCLPAGMGSG